MGQLGARKENEDADGAEEGTVQRVPEESVGQWLIWADDIGEELAAEAVVEEVAVLLFGRPRKRGVRQLETRLWNLIESAEREAKRDTGPRPIPGSLHHALAKLLDWLGEIDGVQGRHRMSAFALYESDNHIAFGYIGGHAPTVIANGEPLEVEWQALSDRRDREARGFGVIARDDLRLEIEWSTPGRDGQTSTVRAEWRGGDFAVEAASPALRLHEEHVEEEPQTQEWTEEDEVPQTEQWQDDQDPPTDQLPYEDESEVEPTDEYEAYAPEAFAMEPEQGAPDSEPAAPASRATTEASPKTSSRVVPVIPSLTAWIPEPDEPTIPEVTPSAVGQNEGGFFQWLDRVVARRRGSDDDPAQPAQSENWDQADLSEADVSEAAELAEQEAGQPLRSSEESLDIVHGPVPVETWEPPAPVTPRRQEPQARSAQGHEAPVQQPVTRPAAARPTAARPAPAPTQVVAPSAPPTRPQPHAPQTRPVESVSAARNEPARVEPSARTPEVVGHDDARASAVEREYAEPVHAEAAHEPVHAEPFLDELEASEAEARPSSRRSPRRPEWPAHVAHEREKPPLMKFLPTAIIVLVLFAGGWLLGRQSSNTTTETGPSPMLRALRGVGLAAPRFDLQVTSTPPGALIAVGGKNLNRRTPSTIELTPGEHTVTLSVPEFGSASFKVKGESGKRVPLEANLTGSLTVRPVDVRRPIRVSIDGVDKGLAPVTVTDLAPGHHEARFSAPGMTPWGQTVRVGIREETDIVARPFQSAATGLLEIRGTVNEEDGVLPVKGATVWIDGRRRGVTPLTLELSAGPHSIRVQHRDEQAAVQVIDLPGGNQRFASFQFGTGADAPQLTLLTSAGSFPRDRASVVSVSLEGITAHEVREMWLHVKNPEGVWRRYPMAQLEGSGAVIGVAVFPLALLDNRGRAPYYASASTTLGDEYFSEMQNVDPPASESAPSAPAARPGPAPAPTEPESQP